MLDIPDYKIINTEDTVIIFFIKNLDIVSIKKNKFKKISKNQIVEFYNKNIQNQNNDKISLKKRIYKIMLNLSDDCNLNCIYCYAKKYFNNLNITQKTIDKLISKFFLSDKIYSVNKIVFFGGEPLLNVTALEYFLAEIEKLFKLKKIPNIPIYSVITNGTIYNDKISRLLKDNNIGVIVSIDGPKDLQNFQRPFKNSNKSSFNIVSNNIKKMVSDGINIGYECTITKRTLELGYNEYKLKEYFSDEFGLSYGFMVPENYTSHEKYFDYYKFTNIKNEYIEALYSLNLNDEYFEIPYRLLTKQPLLHPCGLGRDIFHILSNGDIYPCQLISGIEDFKIGSLDFFNDKIFDDNCFTKIFDAALNESCQKCWIKHLCKYCPARNYLETKKFFPDEKICQNRISQIEELIIEVVELRKNPIKWGKFVKKVKNRRENINESLQID